MSFYGNGLRLEPKRTAIYPQGEFAEAFRLGSSKCRADSGAKVRRKLWTPGLIGGIWLGEGAWLLKNDEVGAEVF